MSPRADPIRVRHAVLIASAVGLVAASRQLKVSPARLSEWRKRLERETGETFPRRHDRKGKRRPFPLSARQIAELRAKRARKVSWGVLARIYGVSPATCRRACGEPSMSKPHDQQSERAWSREDHKTKSRDRAPAAPPVGPAHEGGGYA